MVLNETQRQRLELRLREERERVTQALDRNLDARAAASPQDRVGEFSSLPSHPADAGTDTMQEELASANAARMSRQLAEIDAALERLHREPERFGLCEDTGDPIPIERLELIPWARTCGEAGA